MNEYVKAIYLYYGTGKPLSALSSGQAKAIVTNAYSLELRNAHADMVSYHRLLLTDVA